MGDHQDAGRPSSSAAAARENVRRTVFAVGDEKQSIFSFQGAAPLAFADNRRHFKALFEDAEAAFVEERFEYSFRSGPVVLGAVDSVFAREQAFRGLSHDPVKTVHQAVYADAPGPSRNLGSDRAR